MKRVWASWRSGAAGFVLTLAVLTASAALDAVDAPEPLRLVIAGNTIEDTGIGVYLSVGEPSGREVVVEGNRIVDNAEGVRVRGARFPHRIEHNQLLDNIVGIKLQAALTSQTEDVEESALFTSQIFRNEIQANDVGLMNTTTQPALLRHNDWGEGGRPLSEVEIKQRRLMRARLQQALQAEAVGLKPMAQLLRRPHAPSNVALSLWLSVSLLELLHRQADRIDGPVLFDNGGPD